MKLTAILASVIAVLLVSLFFVSRQAAILRANELMSPLISHGWSNFETSLQFPAKGGLVPVWWVRYHLENTSHHPVAVYVSVRGEIDDWEVRPILEYYESQSGKGESFSQTEKH